MQEKFVRYLDFDSLQRVNKNFVTEEYKEKESDIIWKIDFKNKPLYIFILIEFQSTVDYSMPLRFLRYITEFYQSFYGKTESGKLPAVFPVLLYNGEARWTVPWSIEDMIEPNIPGKYIPKFHYYRVLENEIPKSSLVKIKNALAAVFYTETSSSEELQDEMDRLIELIRDEDMEVVQEFTRWLNNFLSTMMGEEAREGIVKKIESVMEVKFMLETKWKEYRERLREEGKGEKAREAARKMLDKGFSVDDICEITGLSPIEVEKLKKDKS